MSQLKTKICQTTHTSFWIFKHYECIKLGIQLCTFKLDESLGNWENQNSNRISHWNMPLSWKTSFTCQSDSMYMCLSFESTGLWKVMASFQSKPQLSYSAEFEVKDYGELSHGHFHHRLHLKDGCRYRATALWSSVSEVSKHFWLSPY